ncbi:hypothetical protein O181_029239 [Austropuccinia psidii MF-1]|uniref:Uncharacterized protein n=1 Tax=Austropuccinia psidii MF-1 TaxID=1389203 RepID=A0A9Q3CQI6_9BASI|nr:hypothetical protein [Austropuccinia psidii MF-1]
MAPRQKLKCYYCLEEGHSEIRCNNLMEDLEKRIVLKHGGTYLFPNFQRVPTEGPISENNLQEKTVIDDHKDEKEAAIVQIEEWGTWKPPQISPENENLQMNVVLRKTRQEAQSQAQQENKNETQKSLKKNIPGAYHEEYEAEEEIRVSIPTKYKEIQEVIERYNENIEIIFKKGNKEIPKQDSQKMELKNKVKSTVNNPKPIIEHVMKKIFEQKINLTLE